MKNIRRKTVSYIVAHLLACISVTAVAQRPAENTMSAYYANKMLFNPAMTAADGSKIYALHNRSWIGFDGAPVLTNISGEIAFGKNSALGVMYTHDKAGILIRSFGSLSYAYSIKFNDKEQIRLGASLAFNNDRLDNKGAVNDPVINSNVKSNNHFDGNFGIVYMKKMLKLGLTVNRIGENLDGKDPRSNLAMAVVSGHYGFNINKDEKLYLEPMAMFRFYRGTSAIADAGFLFRYNKMVNVMSVYQTSGNIRMGLGLALKELGEANIYYNTNHKISNSNSQQYEVGIGIYLLQKKKSD